MPNWNQVLAEINSYQRDDSVDFVRKKYLAELNIITGRNIIAYYSGWLQRPPGLAKAAINDDDKNAFMAAIHGLDRSKGLDLILHTPGGDTAATESIVGYLRSMFDTDIRAIIPQIAMSAGTMVACACKEIIMGKQSNLGPIDPQFGGIPCNGVIEEFNRALQAIRLDPATTPIWQVIIGKYHPTFIGECQKAIDWSADMVAKWLETGMFKGQKDAIAISRKIVGELNANGARKTHAYHISMEECQRLGLKIVPLEEHEQSLNFQDTVLTIHHAYMHSIARDPSVVKVVENHMGQAMVFHQQ